MHYIPAVTFFLFFFTPTTHQTLTLLSSLPSTFLLYPSFTSPTPPSFSPPLPFFTSPPLSLSSLPQLLSPLSASYPPPPLLCLLPQCFTTRSWTHQTAHVTSPNRYRTVRNSTILHSTALHISLTLYLSHLRTSLPVLSSLRAWLHSLSILPRPLPTTPPHTLPSPLPLSTHTGVWWRDSRAWHPVRGELQRQHFDHAAAEG